MSRIKRPILFSLIAMIMAAPAWAGNQRALEFAVVAYRQKDDILTKWQPLAAYLQTALGRRVEVHVYDYDELNDAVNRNTLDVVLTNPAHSLFLQHHYSLSAPLATLVTLVDGQALTATGGVIFTRIGRADISGILDLAGKRIATATTQSLSGYESQSFEMAEAGVPLPRGNRLLQIGLPHDRVVEAVLDGRADAGFVRTGLLEAMAKEGRLDLKRVRIINRQNMPAFPYAASTRLYPEWPVGVMPQVDEDMARRLTVALLSMPPGGVVPDEGFTVPADYSGVEGVLRTLRQPPFDTTPAVRLVDVWAHYRYWILLVAAGSGASLILALVLLSSNRRLAAARRDARKNALRYGFLLETATDGIHILDASGRLLEASESFYRMLDYSKGTPLGIGDWEAVGEPGATDRRIDALMQQPRIFETRYRRRDGQIIDVEISAQGITFDGVPQVYASARDITPRKAAERALAESESRYRAQSERLTEVIWGTNAGTWEWNLLTGEMALNQRWAELIGYRLEDLSPSDIDTWKSLAHPDDQRRAEQVLEQCFRRQIETYECEIRLRHQNGEWCWGLDRGRVVEWDSDGKPVRMSGTRQDIAERKQTEAELDQHRQHLEELVRRRTLELSASETRANRIIELAPDGLFGVDADARITFFNRAASRMLGYSAEAVIGRYTHEIFHGGDGEQPLCKAEDCAVLECLRTGVSTRCDNDTLLHADGHAVPVMYASHPLLQDGEIAGAVVSFVDLSARRAVEEAREQALAAAERLAQARRDFLANMSHEIRTPLNGILGFAGIGFRSAADADKAKDAFAKILDSGQLLLGIVNDILDYSKIEHGSLVLEAIPVDMVEVLRNTTALVTDRAAAKGLAIRVSKAPDVPRTFLGDPLRLKQILTNLLANAVKFTDAGAVTLAVSRVDDHLIFEVSDTGIGMDEGQLDRLFSPFEQADGSTTRKFGGTGLGLAITHRLVELFGGTIEVRSTVGSGSTFTVSLPYHAAESEGLIKLPTAASISSHLPGHGDATFLLSGLRILVAEDNEINQMVIQEILEEAGAQVVLAENGQAALDQVLREGLSAFDLVLMDVQMPVMDGYEATRRIRQVYPALPIIGQTADAFLEDREKCHAAGMVAHIAKPIDPDNLVNLIRLHAGTAAKGRNRPEKRRRH